MLVQLKRFSNRFKILCEEFKRDLMSKDEIIINLQSEVKELKIMEEVASESCSKLDSENKELKKGLEQIKNQHVINIANMQQMLDEKDNLNKALVENINTLKEKVVQFGELQKQLEEMNELKKKLEVLQTELNKKELEHEKALIELERKHNTELVELNRKHVEDIHEYQIMFLKKQEEKEE